MGLLEEAGATRRGRVPWLRRLGQWLLATHAQGGGGQAQYWIYWLQRNQSRPAGIGIGCGIASPLLSETWTCLGTMLVRGPIEEAASVRAWGVPETQARLPACSWAGQPGQDRAQTRLLRLLATLRGKPRRAQINRHRPARSCIPFFSPSPVTTPPLPLR